MRLAIIMSVVAIIMSMTVATFANHVANQFVVAMAKVQK